MSRIITASQKNKIASALDQIAEIFEKKASQLGVPQSVGTDFAYRCDLLSDAIEKSASKNTTMTEARRFDPSQVGQRTQGPLRMDDEDTYLSNEFTGEEFSALSDMIEHGHNFHEVSLVEDETEEKDNFTVDENALSKMAFDLFASDDEEDEDEDEDEDEEDEDEDEEDEDEEDEEEDDEEEDDEEEDDDEKTQKKARLILAALNIIASEDEDEDDEDEDEEDEEDEEEDDEDDGKSAVQHLKPAHRRKLSQSAKRDHRGTRKKQSQSTRTQQNKSRKRSRSRGANV